MAPPENGDDGSIASTATVAPVARMCPTSALVSVDFPAPGAPVIKVELALNTMIPAKERGMFSLRLILHGRAVCVARKPRCDDCVLADFCPSAGGS